MLRVSTTLSDWGLPFSKTATYVHLYVCVIRYFSNACCLAMPKCVGDRDRESCASGAGTAPASKPFPDTTNAAHPPAKQLEASCSNQSTSISGGSDETSLSSRDFWYRSYADAEPRSTREGRDRVEPRIHKRLASRPSSPAA